MVGTLGLISFSIKSFLSKPAFVAIDITYAYINSASYSSDGITWTATTLPVTEVWDSIAYGNNTFIALPDATSSAALSTNGITWTLGTSPGSQWWVTTRIKCSRKCWF
jgi:hypothetical protein